MSTDPETTTQDQPVAENPVDPKEVNSRTLRPTGSVHYGDVDFDIDGDIADATWGEVGRACCTHSGEEWGMIAVGTFCVLFFLYFFLFGLELLGNSAKVVGGCSAGGLFGDDQNPVAGIMIGILATVFLQSSSTTTSIVVSLVPGIISVKQGIYMIMGANIGTSVTNTIVAIGQMGDGDQLERAFGAAVVHDLFNFLTVACLFPLELVTGYLYRLTTAIVASATTGNREKWNGPIKKIVSPLGKKIIIANKSIIKKVAQGKTCEEYYPTNCTGSVSYKTCEVGLISCNKKDNTCPMFFQDNATQNDDLASGAVVLVLSIFVLFVCLAGLVYCLQRMLLGMSTRIIYKATNVNGYLAILVGIGITIVVQSSSITTSALTPLCGVGVLRIEQMLPLTLGANIGTTITAIIAALVSSDIEPLQVALAHLFFNITGIAIWYPIPFMRKIPIAGARRLGKATRMWRGFPILYIFIVFFCIPGIFLGISALFEKQKIGFTVLGVFIVLGIAFSIMYSVYWCKWKGGNDKIVESFKAREKRRKTMATLPEDMETIKDQVKALIEHTGLEYDAEAGNEEAEKEKTEAKEAPENASSEEEVAA